MSWLHLFGGGTGAGPEGARVLVHCETEQTGSSGGGESTCSRSPDNHRKEEINDDDPNEIQIYMAIYQIGIKKNAQKF